MNPTIILAAIVVLPIVVLTLFRINAALVFLSLCLGDVLVQFIAPDANSLLGLFASHSFDPGHVGSDTIHLFLLLTPAVLTTIFMIRTVKSKSKLLLNVLPAIGVGLLAALLIVPLMAPGLQHDVMGSPLWSQVQRSQVLIVSSSAIVCLLFIWMQRPSPKHNGKHGKR